jgi:hypothetical protein
LTVTTWTPRPARRVEDDGQGAREGLALARLHLGDRAAVQDHAADELHVEVPHAHGALAGLARDGERLGQQLVEGLPVAGAFAERVDALAQLRVRLELELGLERVDARDALLVRLELLRLARAERPIQDAHAYEGSGYSAG